MRAETIALFISEHDFTPQHGGKKMSSGTYWVTVDAAKRAKLAAFEVTSESLRAFVLDLCSPPKS